MEKIRHLVKYLPQYDGEKVNKCHSLASANGWEFCTESQAPNGKFIMIWAKGCDGNCDSCTHYEKTLDKELTENKE